MPRKGKGSKHYGYRCFFCGKQASKKICADFCSAVFGCLYCWAKHSSYNHDIPGIYEILHKAAKITCLCKKWPTGMPEGVLINTKKNIVEEDTSGLKKWTDASLPSSYNPGQT